MQNLILVCTYSVLLALMVVLGAGCSSSMNGADTADYVAQTSLSSLESGHDASEMDQSYLSDNINRYADNVERSKPSDHALEASALASLDASKKLSKYIGKRGWENEYRLAIAHEIKKSIEKSTAEARRN